MQKETVWNIFVQFLNIFTFIFFWISFKSDGVTNSAKERFLLSLSRREILKILYFWKCIFLQDIIKRSIVSYFCLLVLTTLDVIITKHIIYYIEKRTSVISQSIKIRRILIDLGIVKTSLWLTFDRSSMSFPFLLLSLSLHKNQ